MPRRSPRQEKCRPGSVSETGTAWRETLLGRYLYTFYVFGFRDHILARVGRGLHPEEAGITAIELHELRVRALLDEAAVLEEHDPVGAAHGGEPVRDVNRGPPARERTQPLEQVVLGLRIQR